MRFFLIDRETLTSIRPMNVRGVWPGLEAKATIHKAYALLSENPASS